MTQSILKQKLKQIRNLSESQNESDWQNSLPAIQAQINNLHDQIFSINQNYGNQHDQAQVSQNKQILSLLALCYYGIAKINQKYQPFQKAISVLSKTGFPVEIQILWRLQSAAVLSSVKKHQQAFNTAIVVIEKSIELLGKLKSEKHQKIIDSVINQYVSNSQAIPVWFYNKNYHISNASVTQQFRKIYLMSDSFQIADIMAMQIPEYQDFIKEVKLLSNFEQSLREDANPELILNTLQKMILYISIGCFTRATQNYYMKNYTQKQFHVKAVKIASFIFTNNSSFIDFLLSTLSEHFGKHLKAIEQVQEHSNSLISQLKRMMPKDTKQVSMIGITLCDE